MAPTVVAHRAGEQAAALVERTFREVLRPAFVPDELPGIEGMVDPTSGRLTLDLLVALDGEDPVAAAVHSTDERGVALLSYLAARADRRGHGLGGLLVGALREVWGAAGVHAAVAEIHDPRVHAEQADEHPLARLRFYERNGCGLLGPWVQPSLDGLPRVAGMLLITLHLGADARAIGAVEGRDLLTPWAERYFVDEEGAVPSDAQAEAILSWYREERVPIRPLARYQEVPSG